MQLIITSFLLFAFSGVLACHVSVILKTIFREIESYRIASYCELLCDFHLSLNVGLKVETEGFHSSDEESLIRQDH